MPKLFLFLIVFFTLCSVCRRKNSLSEKKMEEKVVNDKFAEHLVEADLKEQKRLEGAKTIANFWDKQCQEIQQMRQKERQVNVEYQDAVKRQEGEKKFLKKIVCKILILSVKFQIAMKILWSDKRKI